MKTEFGTQVQILYDRNKRDRLELNGNVLAQHAVQLDFMPAPQNGVPGTGWRFKFELNCLDAHMHKPE